MLVGFNIGCKLGDEILVDNLKSMNCSRCSIVGLAVNFVRVLDGKVVGIFDDRLAVEGFVVDFTGETVVPVVGGLLLHSVKE